MADVVNIVGVAVEYGELVGELIGVVVDGNVGACIAVPNWFDSTDRHAVVDALGHLTGDVALVGVPTAAAMGWVARQPQRENAGPTVVVVVDPTFGCSVTLVEVGPSAVRELAAAGAYTPPTGDRTAVGGCLAFVLDKARLRGCEPVAGILVVDRSRLSGMSARVPGAVDAATAAAMIASANRGVSVSTVAYQREVLAGAQALVGGAVPCVQRYAPHAIGIRSLDDGSGDEFVFPLVERGEPLPVEVTQVFAVEPQERRAVRADVYEGLGRGDAAGLTDHRWVATARCATSEAGELPGGVGQGAEVVELSLRLDGNGVLGVDPCSGWVLTHRPSRVTIGAVRIAAAPNGQSLADRGAEPSAAELTSALGHVSALVSAAVGEPLVVGSVFALFGCDDAAELVALRRGADRLDEVLARRDTDDPCTASLVHAAALGRRALENANGPRFIGGSIDQISQAGRTVVDHLRALLGAIPPVEQRRLVLDARRAGLSTHSATTLVRHWLGGVERGDVAPGDDAHEAIDDDLVVRLTPRSITLRTGGVSARAGEALVIAVRLFDQD
ncbi:MAG: hypothetical protein WCO88_03560 [Actinomycetota bacterium]